jgi:AraC-like DNA-binding protein
MVRVVVAQPTHLAVPMQLYLLPPPYDKYTTALPSRVRSAAALVKPGEIVAIDIESGSDPQEIGSTVRAIRKHIPWAVVTGRLRAATIEPETVHTLRNPRARGMRAVVHDREPLEPTLRRLLTRPESLKEVPDWLIGVEAAPGCEMAGRAALSADVLLMVRALFAESERLHDTTALAAYLGRTEANLRYLLMRCRLPAPAVWIKLATRLLPDAMALQRRATTLAVGAIERGWSDQSAMTRAFTRSFRWTPGQGSRRVGWEWLMHAWLGAHSS